MPLRKRPTWWNCFDQVKTLIRTRRKSEKSDLNVRTNPILVNASTGGRSQNVFFWGWPEEANPRKVISSTRIFLNPFISFVCLYFCVFVLTRMLTNLFVTQRIDPKITLICKYFHTCCWISHYFNRNTLNIWYENIKRMA